LIFLTGEEDHFTVEVLLKLAGKVLGVETGHGVPVLEMGEIFQVHFCTIERIFGAMSDDGTNTVRRIAYHAT